MQGPQGLQGIQGAQGAAGKTAYQNAQEGGFTDIETVFSSILASLKTASASAVANSIPLRDANSRIKAGAAVASDDVLVKSQFDLLNNSYSRAPGYALDEDDGYADSIVVTLSPAPPAYTDGMRVVAKITMTNASSSVYLNVNGLGTKSIKNARGGSLLVGELIATYTYEFIYNSTLGAFVVMGSSANAATLQGYTAVQIASQSTDYTRVPGYVVAGGTANAITVTLNPAPSVYADGMRIAIRIVNINTGATTINVNGLGAKNVFTTKGESLIGSTLTAGCIYEFIYSSAYNGFLLQGSSMNAYQLQGYTPATVASQSTDYTRVPGYAADTGAVNAYVITPSPAISAYATGQRFYVKILNTNTTTTPTINVNALGTKTIVRTDSTAVAIGELSSGVIYELIYDGTYFRLLGVSKAYVDTKAPLASPALTGTPTSPTAANGTNTTQIATTAFVNAAKSDISIIKDQNTSTGILTGIKFWTGTQTEYNALTPASDTFYIIK